MASGSHNCCGNNSRCSSRSFLLLICSLQLISSILRQVIDFMAQMWLPILFNFFATIFTLIGLFGVYYMRPTHLSLYILFQMISLSWNSFVIAFYLEIPPLNRNSEIMNLGTGSQSFWALHGPRCQPEYNVTGIQWGTDEIIPYDPWFQPITVHNCLIPFYVIEAAQAALQIIISLIAFAISIYILFTSCIQQKQRPGATLRPGVSGHVAPSLPSHYSISMSYDPQAVGNNTLSSRSASHRRSVSSLPNRRSMNRGKRNRSSTRSTASARRRKRMQRASHRQANNSAYDPTTDEYGYASSVYQSQNQLISSHYDASSLDSFNPNGGHANPLYGGSIQSDGSRFSLYTINPQATTERIVVNDHPLGSNAPSSHHNQQHVKQQQKQQNPATISRHRPYLRPRSPIYMNSETVM